MVVPEEVIPEVVEPHAHHINAAENDEGVSDIEQWLVKGYGAHNVDSASSDIQPAYTRIASRTIQPHEVDWQDVRELTCT
jgi:hypothetical protein